MRKVLLIISFLFCTIIAFGQEFCVLKQTADSLAAKKKYKKALNLYNQAIERVVTYKDVVLNGDWTDVSIAAANVSGKLNKKTKPEYAFVKYGPNGDVYRNKIADLKSKGLRCVFSYQLAGGMTISSYVTFLPGTKTLFNIGTSNDRRILVWAENKEVFLQCFDNLNVYKPIKIVDEQFVDICLNHFTEVTNDKIKPRALKHSEQTWIEIIIPADTEGRYVKRFDYDDVTAPQREIEEGRFKWVDDKYKEAMATYQLNSQTYITKLLPLLLAQWRKHFIPEISF